MNYNNNDDNRIRRKKVSSNDYNYKSKQHQRYYKEKVRLDNASYERKIENNKIKKKSKCFSFFITPVEEHQLDIHYCMYHILYIYFHLLCICHLLQICS